MDDLNGMTALRNLLLIILAALAWAGAVFALLWSDLPGALVQRDFNSTHKGKLTVRGLRPVTRFDPPQGSFDGLELESPDGEVLLKASSGTFGWKSGPDHLPRIERVDVRSATALVVLDDGFVPRAWMDALSSRRPGGGGTGGVWPLTLRARLSMDIRAPGVSFFEERIPVRVLAPGGTVELSSQDDGSGAFGALWKGVSVSVGPFRERLDLIRVHGSGSWSGWSMTGRADLLDGTVRLKAHGHGRVVSGYELTGVRLSLPRIGGRVDFALTGPESVRWKVNAFLPRGTSIHASGIGRVYTVRLHDAAVDATLSMKGLEGTYDARARVGRLEVPVHGHVTMGEDRNVLADGHARLENMGVVDFQGSFSPRDRRFVGLVGTRGVATTVDYTFGSGALRGSGEFSALRYGGVRLQKGRFSFHGVVNGQKRDVNVDVRHARILAQGRWLDFSGRVHIDHDIGFDGSVGMCGGILRTRGTLSPFDASFGGTVSLSSCVSRMLRGRAWVSGTARQGYLRVSMKSSRVGIMGVNLHDVTSDIVLSGTNISLKATGRRFSLKLKRRNRRTQLHLEGTDLVVPAGPFLGQVSADLDARFDGDPSPATLSYLNGALSITSLKVPEGVLYSIARGRGLVRFDTRGSDISLFGTWSPDRRGLPSLQFSGRWHHGRGTVRVDFSRLPIHELTDLRGIRAWVMGSAEVGVSQDKDGQIRISGATLRLKGLLIHVPARDGHVVVVRNRGDVILRKDGARWRVSGGLTSLGRSVRVSGFVGPDAMDVRIKGSVDGVLVYEMLGFGDWLTTISGGLGVNLRVMAPSPEGVSGTLVPQGVSLRLKGGIDVSVKTGKARVHDGQVTLDDVRLSSMGRELVLSGTVSRKGGGISVKGQVDLSLFGRLVPSSIARLTGVALVDGRVSFLDGVSFHGSVALSGTELVLRYLNHPLELKHLHANVDGCKLTISDVRGALMGGILGARGTVDLCTPDAPGFDLSLDLKDFHYERVGVFYADANSHLILRGRVPDAILSGHIDLIDAKYYQKFDVIKHILRVRRIHEESEPFWARHPQFGATALDIEISNSGRMRVENNISSLDLVSSLHLGGTLRNPMLSGRVLVTGGSFTIPFLKGTYTVQDGSVELVPGSAPMLRLVGETQVEHYTGESFMIKLRLRGPLDAISFRLTSDPPLEQGQILMLLASGRTVEDFRQSTRPDPQAGTTTTAGTFNPIEVYDAPIKQVTGDFLSDLVSNPIKSVTRLDLLRLELGVDSIQLRVAKKLGKHVVLHGETEFGLMGRRRQEAALEIKLHDRVSIDSRLRRYVPDQDTYEYEERLQGRVEIKYLLDLKGGLSDVFGF